MKNYKIFYSVLAMCLSNICFTYSQTTGLSGTSANPHGAGTTGSNNTNVGASAGANGSASANYNSFL